MPYNFCPSCGAVLDPRLSGAAGGRVCARCGWVVYDTPRPCAGALVIHEGKLLLVRRATEPFLGWWDIPGGFLNPGEHPELGAVRELEEETGLAIEPVGLVGIYPGTYGPDQTPTLSLVYRARVLGGRERAASDAAEVRWFNLDELPDEIAFDWSRDAIRALRVILAHEAG